MTQLTCVMTVAINTGLRRAMEQHPKVVLVAEGNR